MLPVKKIIATTDFSEPSMVGVHAAVELAQTFGAELILVHVIHPVQTASGAATLAGVHLPTAEEKMEQEVTDLANKIIEENVPGTVSGSIRILRGKPAQKIARLAEEEGADLIVVATRGESGWQQALALFGSVAESIVRNAQCPVLTVPTA